MFLPAMLKTLIFRHFAKSFEPGATKKELGSAFFGKAFIPLPPTDFRGVGGWFFCGVRALHSGFYWYLCSKAPAGLVLAVLMSWHLLHKARIKQMSLGFLPSAISSKRSSG